MSFLRLMVLFCLVCAVLFGSFAAARAQDRTVNDEVEAVQGRAIVVPTLSAYHPPDADAGVVLYNNGPFITAPGGGPNGTNASVLQNTTLGMTTLGFGFARTSTASIRIADDFTITDASGWRIDSVTVYAYQTQATPDTINSTFNTMNIVIWDGPPGQVGSNIVFGDTLTNRMVSSYWQRAVRISQTTVNLQRAVMRTTASAGVTLPPGTYWLDYQVTTATLASAFGPPITIIGDTVTGNARQLGSGGTWGPIGDGSSPTTRPQGMPFLLHGEILAPPPPATVGWRVGPTGVTVGFDGLFMLNQRLGWLSGDLGRILKTTDGGKTWVTQTTPTSVYLYSINFVDSLVGYAAGSGTSPGIILKTTNGGSTWSQVGSITGFSFLHAIDFINADTGWVGGTGGFIRTTNGGQTWVTVAQTGTIYQIDFVNSMVGWAVADAGRIFKTTDGGANWIQQTSGTTQPLHDVHAFDVNIAWAVGNLSTVRRTTDGGTTWTTVTTPIPAGLWAWGVHFATANTGWISGDQGWIVKTTDGGATWYRQLTPSAALAQPLYQIKSASPTHVVTGGGAGLALWTENGGEAPAQVVSPTSLAYGNVQLGRDSTRTFTIRNTGTMALQVDSLASTNGNFAVVGITLPRSVNVGDTLFVPVRFAPVDTGQHSGTIRVVTNDPYNPLRTVSVTGRGVGPTGVTAGEEIPSEFGLHQNYPNPFNPATQIQYALPKSSFVTIRVFSLLGEEVTTVVNADQAAGYHVARWDGRNASGAPVGSGMYFYRMEARPTEGEPFISVKKMLLIK